MADQTFDNTASTLLASKTAMYGGVLVHCHRFLAMNCYLARKSLKK